MKNQLLQKLQKRVSIFKIEENLSFLKRRRNSEMCSFFKKTLCKTPNHRLTIGDV